MWIGGVVGAFAQELVIAGHGGQRALVRWEAGDHGCGVRREALGEADNAVLDDLFLRAGIAIGADPPRGPSGVLRLRRRMCWPPLSAVRP